MKYLKFIFIALAVVCFFEVYYMSQMLSFTDYPYLYMGVLFLVLSIYLFIKNRNDINR